MKWRAWMVAVVLVMLGPSCSGPSEDQSAVIEPAGPTTPAPEAETTTSVTPPGEPPAWNDLVGGWRPVLPDGRRVRVIRVNGWPLTIHFRELADGHWWDGYDGCNWTSGRLRLRPSGGFYAREPTTTLRLCGPVRNPLQMNTTAALMRGHQMLLHEARLMILDEHDGVIASYVRSRVHR